MYLEPNHGGRGVKAQLDFGQRDVVASRNPKRRQDDAQNGSSRWRRHRPVPPEPGLEPGASPMPLEGAVVELGAVGPNPGVRGSILGPERPGSEKLGLDSGEPGVGKEPDMPDPLSEPARAPISELIPDPEPIPDVPGPTADGGTPKEPPGCEPWPTPGIGPAPGAYPGLPGMTL